MDFIASYSSDESENSNFEDKDSNKSNNADFFHLESSDTDEDQLEFPKHDVQSLLKSAHVLSDSSYGPELSVQTYSNKDHSTSDENFVHRTQCFLKTDSVNVEKLQYECCDNSNSKQRDGCRDDTNFKHSDDTLFLDEKNVKRQKTDSDSYPKDEKIFYRSDVKIIQAITENKSCFIPNHITHMYEGHSNAVTALSWCVPQYSHLLLTASTDCLLKVWDMSCKNPAKILSVDSGIKAAKWTCDGKRVTCGGFGKRAHVIDIFTGEQLIEYGIGNFVTSIENHLENPDIFLVGTKNKVMAFDTRNKENLPIRSYESKCNDVLDIAFLNNHEFICSTSIVSHDSADRTIMSWDFPSGAILSNQIYLERYSCPHLKVAPSGKTFVAQTNGDYIAVFCAQRPYKMKNKRYVGHKVSGYGIQCDLSPDEKFLISGDAHGDVYIYNYQHSNLVQKLSVKPGVPINCVQWHPVLSKTIATSSWDGNVQIWG